MRDLAAADRAGRERRPRYCARPPFALDRLRELDRLAALVPLPCLHYLDVLARTTAYMTFSLRS